MKRKLFFIVSALFIFVSGALLGQEIGKRREQGTLPAPLATPIPTPLTQYQIENLSKTLPADSTITREEMIKETDEFISYQFALSFYPKPLEKTMKKTTGMVTIPKTDGSYPLIVMIRGYVDQKLYETGMGTRPAAEFFAKNGFVTVSPDFLGYGGSDSESANIYETRFQTYTTALALLNTIENIPFSTIVDNKWDRKNIFLWAHSNGGQIALTALAITGKAYPTTLWAPVTKPFPYSILYYTDESADGGKYIRSELAKIEEIYDVNLFSFTTYIDRIKAPLQFHQGTIDDAIQYRWTRDFANKLKKQGNEVTYYQYPGSDHNLRPAWDEVVQRDLEFFRSKVLQ